MEFLIAVLDFHRFLQSKQKKLYTTAIKTSWENQKNILDTFVRKTTKDSNSSPFPKAAVTLNSLQFDSAADATPFFCVPHITFRHLNIYAHPTHYWRYLFLFIIKFTSCSMHRALSGIHVFNYLNWRPGRPPPRRRGLLSPERKDGNWSWNACSRVKIQTISNDAAYFDFMDNMIMSPLCEISWRIQLLCNSSVAINSNGNKKCFTGGPPVSN